MTDEHAEALATYARFFETLTPARVVFLRDLAVPDVRFKDPFNDVRGVEPMIAAISSMYRHGTPRFEVIDRATGEVGAGERHGDARGCLGGERGRGGGECEPNGCKLHSELRSGTPRMYA